MTTPPSGPPGLPSSGRRRTTGGDPSIHWAVTKTEECMLEFLREVSLLCREDSDQAEEVGPSQTDLLQALQRGVSSAHDGHPEPWKEEE